MNKNEDERKNTIFGTERLPQPQMTPDTRLSRHAHEWRWGGGGGGGGGGMCVVKGRGCVWSGVRGGGWWRGGGRENVKYLKTSVGNTVRG